MYPALNTDKTVVIGGGQAAAKCVLELRRLGYEGQITVICDESLPPYQRPELSKSYLARSVSPDEVIMLTPDMADRFDIQLKLAMSVDEVDLNKRLVSTGGNKFEFDKLVFATGGRARKLENALSLRTVNDADHLYRTLQSEKRLSVVGGGWLGLEVAATARSHGLEVSLYEQQERLCARSVPVEISDLLLQHHRSIGVDVRLADEPQDGISNSDIVCACIGMVPNDQLAREAGVEVDRGILVNERQMTSVPNVFAVGDCARQSGCAAYENWAYANVSAERAAHAICDIAVPVNPDLWLWSKQGDLLIQMRGDFSDADECIVRKKKQSACYYYVANNKLVCCIAVNDPAQFGKSRILYRSQKELNKPELAGD